MSELDIKQIIEDAALHLGKVVRYPKYYNKTTRYSEQEIKQSFVLKFYENLKTNELEDKYYLTFETPTKYAYAFHLKDKDVDKQPECDPDRTKPNFQSGQIDVSIWGNDSSGTAYSHIEFKHIPRTDNKAPENRKKITKDLLKLSMEESNSGINYFVFVIKHDNETWNGLKVLLFDRKNYKTKEPKSIYETVSEKLDENHQIKIIIIDRENGDIIGRPIDYKETLNHPDDFKMND